MLNKAIIIGRELYESGMSLPEVSRETGISMSTLRRRFILVGILRDRTSAVKLAGKQGKTARGRLGKKFIFTEEHKNKIKQAAIMRGEATAKGFSLKSNGYIEITRGQHKGQSQHDVVMEESIGRKLNKGECVHHINGDKKDNRIDNLQLMRWEEHNRLHGLLSKRDRDRLGRYIS